MNLVENTGEIVSEPDWQSLFNDVLEVGAAHEYWRMVTSELRDRTLLSAANAHSIQRLVTLYIVFDRSARHVAENGSVAKPKRGSTRAIARISPFHTAMREANSDATALEAELGLSPRRRGAVTKTERKARTSRASDQYLRQVGS